MATSFTATDRPVLTFNGVEVTDYFNNVRTYDFDVLPKHIRDEVLSDELIEPDCS